MKKILWFLFLCFPLWAFAQVEEEEDEFDDISIEAIESTDESVQKNWELNGYIKDLRTMLIADSLSQITLFNNQIHNRLNFTWFLHSKWTFKADLRTQIFYGTLINLANPLERFSESINGVNDDVLDLSWLALDRTAFAVHTMLDRLYLDYNSGKWQVRLGRQRINWGINTLWNPHDIFNAYSFIDFDYEERPGSDALRVQYYSDATSGIEVAVKAFESVDEIVAGGLWRFNKWNYDFQVLGGVYFEDIVLGAGWAGNIGDVGFKGEFSYFQPYNTGEGDLVGTIGLDYSFTNSLYVSAGFLYSSTGSNEGNATGLISNNLTAKNLYPYKSTIFAMVSYPFNPAFSGALSLVYSPSTDETLFINPTLTYSIKDNWDIDVIGQLAAANNAQGEYDMLLRILFLRLKWSF